MQERERERECVCVCASPPPACISLTRHIHKSGYIGDQIVADVIGNEMPSIQHHEHCLTYCAVSASENWRSLIENFATVGPLWVSVDGSMMSSCGCLSQMFVTYSVSHSMCVLCSLWITMKSYFIVPSFEAGTVSLSKMCCLFIQWNIWDGFCVTFCRIYVQFREF